MTCRAMVAITLDDRAAAEEIYATLLARYDGPPPDATSLLVELRPVAHTLGELAAVHLAQTATIADRWSSPHWAAEARSRTTT